MNKINSAIIFFLVVVSTRVCAQNEGTGKRAIDATPVEIQKQFIKWGKSQNEEKSMVARMSKGPADTWLFADSQPVEGFIIPRKGEKLSGKIVLHKRWNKG